VKWRIGPAKYRFTISSHCAAISLTAAYLETLWNARKILAAGSFAAQAEKLPLYKSIAIMDIPALRNQNGDKAADLALSWQLNKLAERLSALARA
jgi:hypothetical protein